MANKIEKIDDPKPALKCGLIMPISPTDGYPDSHWPDVKGILVEALAGTNFSVEMVSEAEGNGLIHNRIVTNVYENDIVICDVSSRNPNVMFELGMRLAFDKPVIIIKDDRTSYSFDATPIEHLAYPGDLNYPSIQSFKEKLRERTVAAYAKSLQAGYESFLKNFGQVVVKGLDKKVIGRDDFMLDSMRAMQNEIKALAHMVQRNDAGRIEYNYKNNSTLRSLLRHGNSSEIDRANQYLERSFKNFMGSEPNVKSLRIKDIAAHAANEYMEARPQLFDDDSADAVKRRSDTIAMFYELAMSEYGRPSVITPS